MFTGDGRKGEWDSVETATRGTMVSASGSGGGDRGTERRVRKALLFSILQASEPVLAVQGFSVISISCVKLILVSI